MDLTEGVGESSSPTKSYLGGGNYDFRSEVFNRLMESANLEEEAVTNPEEFREKLAAHFNRLPLSYALDVNMDRVEDVLLHQKLLAMAKDPENRPVYNIRFLENICTSTYGNDDQPFHTIPCAASSDFGADEGVFPPSKRDFAVDFEPCFKLEDLNLEMRASKGIEEKSLVENLSIRQRGPQIATIHEVIFSTIDKPKLLSQLSALLSDIGLNIREAHVFSTTDGYSLDVFVVDGWPVEALSTKKLMQSGLKLHDEFLKVSTVSFGISLRWLIKDTDSLYKVMEKAIARSEGSWSGTHCSRSARDKAPQAKSRDWEIDKRLLKIGDKIASGSCGDLHRGVYIGQDVAIKVLRSENLSDTQVEEFAQEVAILREVEHRNVVRFIGACTELPSQCMVTEYMPGGSLYDYLHKNHNAMELPQLIEFAIDVSKGMEYLHQKNIIHRDLKTANLLMDSDNVVKVADFGVARFQSQGGVMTAETGTYRWMAPEVINHQPYDQKADIFSYAIVLWELVTAKVPYDTMTPLQAAIGVRQGLRPDLPKDVHPKLLDLMQRCWDTVPNNRPSFSEITVELEALLQEVKGIPEAGKSN